MQKVVGSSPIIRLRKGATPKAPKTEAGSRLVPLLPALRRRLIEWTLRAPHEQPHERVICTADANPVAERNLRRALGDARPPLASTRPPIGSGGIPWETGIEDERMTARAEMTTVADVAERLVALSSAACRWAAVKRDHAGLVMGAYLRAPRRFDVLRNVAAFA
jgi:hypothetical protein